MPYTYLICEMQKHQITNELLAKSLRMEKDAVEHKLKKGSFSIEEAIQIQEEYFSKIPIIQLFHKE